MSDLQTSIGDDILQIMMIVCLRDGKDSEAVTVVWLSRLSN